MTTKMGLALAAMIGCMVFGTFAGAGSEKQQKYRVYLGTGKDIYQLELDTRDGSMSKSTLAAELANPSFVAIHPSNKFLYSVSEINKGSIVAFAIDAKTRSLTQLNSQSAGASGPSHVAVDRQRT